MGRNTKNIEARLPPGFQQILLQLSIQILRNRPYNILQFCANYFEGELDRRTLKEMTIENYMVKPTISDGMPGAHKETSYHAIQAVTNQRPKSNSMGITPWSDTDEGAEMKPKAYSLCDPPTDFAELKGIEVTIEECASKEEMPTETKTKEDEEALTESQTGIQHMEEGTQVAVLATDGLTQTESIPSMPSVPADSIRTEQEDQDVKKSVPDATFMLNDDNADITKPSNAEVDVVMEQEAEDLPRGKSPEPTPRNQFPTTDETTAEYRANDLDVIGPEDGVDTSDMEMISTREVSLESVRGTARTPASGQQPPAAGTQLGSCCEQWDQKVDKFPLYESAVYDSLYEKEYPPPVYRAYSVDKTIPEMQPGGPQPILPPLASDGAETGACAEGAEKREGAEDDQPPVSTDDVDVGWVDDQANVQHQGETEQDPDQVKGQPVEEIHEQPIEEHYEPQLQDKEKQDQEQPEKEQLANEQQEQEPKGLSLEEQQLQLEHDLLIRQQQERRDTEQMSLEMLHTKQALLEQDELMQQAKKQQSKSNKSVPLVEDNPQPSSEFELIHQSPSTPAADTTDQHQNHDELREDMPRSRSPEPHPPHNFPTSDEKTPQYRARAMSLIGPEDGMSSSDMEVVPKEGSHASIKATAKTPSTGQLEDKKSVAHPLPTLTEDTTNTLVTSSNLTATGDVRESVTDNSQPPESVNDEKVLCGGKPPESGGDVPVEPCEGADCRCPCQPLDLSQVMGAEIGRHTSEELLARVIRQAMYRVDNSDVTPDPPPAGINRRSV